MRISAFGKNGFHRRHNTTVILASSNHRHTSWADWIIELGDPPGSASLRELCPTSTKEIHQVDCNTLTCPSIEIVRTSKKPLSISRASKTHSFFVHKSAGKTLNRFSQDMSLIDLALPTAALFTVISALNCVGSVILVALASPWLALVIPGLLGVIYMLQRVYLRTSRQLRLLILEAKSPLYTHFEEIIAGLETVRAFQWQGNYIHKLAAL